MEAREKTLIKVEADINAPLEKVWDYWTGPEHIIKWNNASDDWHTPRVENYLHKGGKFLYRMESVDGSNGFDFEGIYDEVKNNEQISYTITDGRKVKVTFLNSGNTTTVTEIFEAENTHSFELQHNGWQAILDNFKKYVETN